MRRLLALVLALGLAAAALAQTTHKVKRGENLTEIAKAYNVTVPAIMQANGLSNANQISIGQTLKIPANPPQFLNYTIRRGDSLSTIAKRHRVTVQQISALNGIRNANQIRVGQTLKIPLVDGMPPPPGVPAKPYDPLPSATLGALRATKVKSGVWRHVVVHHSGTRVGSAAGMDRYHREERGMENGLAYHFVIGNGNGMGDGEIALGSRWRNQIQGGHLSSLALNRISIGICLVGDFEKNRPTRRQMEQLQALVHFLMETVNIPPERVTTHTLIHPRHTACPGKLFPTESFRKAIGR